MTDFSLGYQADVTKFSDEEIGRLIKEIEDSGALADDDLLWDQPGCWETAAHSRWLALHAEKDRRWEAANPGAAEIRRASREDFKEMSEITQRLINKETVAAIFSGSKLLYRLKNTR